jgi:hypothetical protein
VRGSEESSTKWATSEVSHTVPEMKINRDIDVDGRIIKKKYIMV